MKIGVHAGGGPPPGYRWQVLLHQSVREEARAFLTDRQYRHLARQVRELAWDDEPTTCGTVDVRPVEHYYEIRDKGGVLRKINARVFFGVHQPSRSIIVVHAVNKKNDGPTPEPVRSLVRYRLRRCFAALGTTE